MCKCLLSASLSVVPSPFTLIKFSSNFLCQLYTQTQRHKQKSFTCSFSYSTIQLSINIHDSVLKLYFCFNVPCRTPKLLSNQCNCNGSWPFPLHAQKCAFFQPPRQKTYSQAERPAPDTELS